MTRLLPFTFLLFTFLSSPAWAINLRWECTSNNEDGFTIEKKDGGTADWSLLGKVAANVTTYLDKPPVPWGRCYRIKAFNTAGESAPSNEACVASGSPS